MLQLLASSVRMLRCWVASESSFLGTLPLHLRCFALDIPFCRNSGNPGFERPADSGCAHLESRSRALHRETSRSRARAASAGPGLGGVCGSPRARLLGLMAAGVRLPTGD